MEEKLIFAKSSRGTIKYDGEWCERLNGCTIKKKMVKNEGGKSHLDTIIKKIISSMLLKTTDNKKIKKEKCKHETMVSNISLSDFVLLGDY